MQRIVEIIYSIPEMLIILLLSATLKPALEQFQNSGDGPMQNLVTLLGPNLISMFIAFGLLYWVTMSRIIRGQILTVKTAGICNCSPSTWRKGGRIISKHLLPNCIGQIVTTTFLQIPSAIFLESFLSFLGVGVSAPLTSLWVSDVFSEALKVDLSTYPYRLFIPAVILSVMILSLNLFGDGLRDALDPKLKK
ncbi:MAG: ABC transporter permease [Eubacterium ramulus]